MEKLVKGLIIIILRILISIKKQLMISGVCRFTPTCSEYAFQAIKKHNIFKAITLIFIRLVKCNPLNSGGEDPVP